MEIVKKRDASAADRAARIWAQATAKRDDNSAGMVDIESAIPLLKQVLDKSERSFLLTLTEGDEMLVFVAVEPSREAEDPTVGEMRYMGVAPGHWGEGWARRILVALPDAMRDSGFDTGELWVYADNIRAIFVYEAMGWTGTDQTRRHEITGRVEQKFIRRLT